MRVWQKLAISHFKQVIFTTSFATAITQLKSYCSSRLKEVVGVILTIDSLDKFIRLTRDRSSST